LQGEPTIGKKNAIFCKNTLKIHLPTIQSSNFLEKLPIIPHISPIQYHIFPDRYIYLQNKSPKPRGLGNKTAPLRAPTATTVQPGNRMATKSDTKYIQILWET
jgi:hypothetical protein